MTDSEHLGNLLAVIHRDGGHYQKEHGTEKAVTDAREIITSLRTELEQLAKVRERCEAETKPHGGRWSDRGFRVAEEILAILE